MLDFAARIFNMPTMVMCVQATVDELRAEIAYCRASLQQMKNADKAPIVSAESTLI